MRVRFPLPAPMKIFKLIILAFELSFIFCFFLGIFGSTENPIHLYNDNHSFYLNRGYPNSWAGVSVANKQVDYPIIKAPFIQIKLQEDGSIVNKIIDLRLFLPFFIITLIIFYILLWSFSRFVKFNKISFVIISGFLLILCLFFYFEWFPRV
jgi:hypothetical protein